MKQNKIILILVFFLIFITSSFNVIAAPPFLETTNTLAGYDILVPLKSNYKVNTATELYIHVFNISNGLAINESIICYMHLYDKEGQHVAELQDSTVSHMFDYAFDITANMLNKTGQYSVLFYCEGNGLGGEVKEIIYVTSTGENNINIGENIPLTIMLFFALLVLVCGGFTVFFILQKHYLTYMFMLLTFVFSTVTSYIAYRMAESLSLSYAGVILKIAISLGLVTFVMFIYVMIILTNKVIDRKNTDPYKKQSYNDVLK